MQLGKMNLSLILVIILSQTLCEAGIVQELLQTVIQGGLAGYPLVHKEQNYEFDPEISQKRRSLFYEVHGYRGEKFIERIGLGIDGKEDERRVEQMIRDEGRLQGLHLYNK